MFPMASSVNAQVDQEMTAFSGVTHVDNLEAYYKILRGMLLDPGWREEDFKRIKDDATNFLRVGLRGNNDEELAKEVLYTTIYEGTSYEHYPVGTVSSIQKITLDDLKRFYHSQYSQSNLVLGLAGGYPPQFLEAMKKDFRKLPEGAGFRPRFKEPKHIPHNRLIIVDKDTRSVAFSLGYPIRVKRGAPDFPALLVAQSYFGQHRMSGGRLYERMREKRGLNYGDYAYIEYFPRGMFQFEPSPNLARRHQIFQIWIRPVEPPTAKFGLRLAMYELNKLVKEGIPPEDFERTRQFLTKNVNLLTNTKSAELGYLIDSLFYGMAEYTQYIKTSLAKLTPADVNRAIKTHLRPDRVVMVAVADNAEQLKKELTSPGPSPMTYNSAKPEEILKEDQMVEKWPLNLRPEDVTIVPVERVFE
jgi:zinc protease